MYDQIITRALEHALKTYEKAIIEVPEAQNWLEYLERKNLEFGVCFFLREYWQIPYNDCAERLGTILICSYPISLPLDNSGILQTLITRRNYLKKILEK